MGLGLHVLLARVALLPHEEQPEVVARHLRAELPEVRAEDDPDAALIAWLDHEEALFRRLERRVVSSRIEAGFTSADGTDVDGRDGCGRMGRTDGPIFSIS